MSAFKQIQKRLEKCDIEKLQRKLDHPNKKELSRHFSIIRQSVDLLQFFNQGFFDYRYSSKEFLLRLAEILNVNKDKLYHEIQKAEKLRDELRKLRDCFIHVDTGFKRTGQSIWSLMALQKNKKIDIDPMHLAYKGEKEMLEIASNDIQNHYKQSGEKLDVFGAIQGYRFICERKIYHFDVDGHLVKTENRNATKG